VTSRHDHEVTSEFDGGRRQGRRPNGQAFAGPLLAWGPGLAGVGMVFAFLGHSWTWVMHAHDPRIAMTYGLDDQDARASIGLILVVVAVALSIIIVVHGIRIVKRDPAVVAHLLASVWLAFVILYITSQWGWSLSWILWHVGLSVIGGGSWAILRTDALRKDPRKDGDAKSDGGIREAVGIATSAVNRKSITPTPFGAKFEIELAGNETIKTIKEALPHLEREARAVPGMSFLMQGENAALVDVNLVTVNPFGDWLPWPGLSHPGESFACGFRTSYYVTGEEMIYYFAALHDRKNPRQRTGIIRMGTTGSGKSGDADMELAEALSRRDCVVVAIIMGKFRQNLGWCQDMLTLAADTPARARTLEGAIWRLVEYRAAAMGGGDDERDWSPEIFRRFGFPAVLFYYDEADKILGRLADKIATTALSVGVFMSATLPAADTKSMPAGVRRSLGTRKCFGTGDSYSADFVLSDETRKLAPDPYEWGVAYPGAQILDRASGVDRRLWSVPGRSYYAGHDELRAACLAARTFAPAAFTPGELAAINADPDEVNVVEVCNPMNIGGDTCTAQPAGAHPGPDVHQGQVFTPPVPPVNTAHPAAGAHPGGIPADVLADALVEIGRRGEHPTPDNIMAMCAQITEQRERVRVDTERASSAQPAAARPERIRLNSDDDAGEDDDVYDYEEDDEDERFVVNIGPPTTSTELDAGDLADMARIDPRGGYVPTARRGGNIELIDDVPRARNQAEADAELDRAIVILVVDRGMTEFGNKDVLDLCRLWDDAMMSRRLKAVSDPERPDMVAPPGIKLHKIRHGRWGATHERGLVAAGDGHRP
jgi:hypothetical protein